MKFSLETKLSAAEIDRRTAGVSAPLLSWYHENRRILPWREEVTPYRVWISEIIKDERELLNYYKGWCPHMDSYYPDNPFTEEGKTRIHRSKNLVSCEAHRELCVMNLNIMLNREEALAAEYWEKLQKLMIMPV